MQTRKKIKLGCVFFCLPYFTNGYAQQNSFLESIEQIDVPQPYGQAASNKPVSPQVTTPAAPNAQARPVQDNRPLVAGAPAALPAVNQGVRSDNKEPPPAVITAEPPGPPQRVPGTIPGTESIRRADLQKALDQARQADSTTIQRLNAQVAELQLTISNHQTAASAASDQTIQSLKAQVASLQEDLASSHRQSGQDAESLQIIPSLKAQVSSLQNQLTSAQRQVSLDAASLQTLPALKAQVSSLQEQLANAQKQARLDALSLQNIPSLKAQVSSLQEQLASAKKPSGPDAASQQTIQSLKAQVALLQSKLNTPQADRGVSLATSELTVQQLRDKVLELELKNQRIEEEKNAAEAALGRHDFELGIATDAARREQAELDERNSRLQQTLSTLDFMSYAIDTAKRSDANAYALGIHYFQKMQSEIGALSGSGTDIAKKPLMRGFIDAYQNKTLINDTTVNQLAGSLLQLRAVAPLAADNRVRVYLSGKVYETLSNGTYLVIEKKGVRAYGAGDAVSWTTHERELTGNRIFNSASGSAKYSAMSDPLLKIAAARGGADGRVTFYGLARALYPAKAIPAGTSPDSPVSVTYTFK